MKAVRNFAWGLRALDLRSVPSLAAGLFMLALTACSPSPITLRGFAVADVNDEIGLLDLETGARRTLLKEEETKDLDSLVAGPPGKILFTSGFYLEGKVVFEFDVCSGVTKRLGAGQSAAYDMEDDAVLFYESSKGAIPDNPQLLLAPYSDLGRGVPIMRGPPIRVVPKGIPLPLIRPPIRVASSRYVAVGENLSLHLIDIRERTATDLGIRCLPTAIRTTTNTLICTDWTAKFKYFELDIDNGWQRRDVGQLSPSLIYVPPDDAVIYGTVEGSLFPIPHENPRVHAYIFDRGTFSVGDGLLYKGFWMPADPAGKPCGAAQTSSP